MLEDFVAATAEIPYQSNLTPSGLTAAIHDRKSLCDSGLRMALARVLSLR